MTDAGVPAFSNCRSARCCAKLDLPEFFLSGAGVAVANIPHSDCTVFTLVTGRQPSLIALGERFKALGSVYQLCVVFGNRQNKAVLAVLLTTSSYSAGCPMGPSASRCCAYRGKGGGVDMPDRGSYSGLARTAHSAQCGRAKAVSPARWSRRTMIPSPLLRRPAVAALAALAITWPGMVSAWAQAQPREGFARTSPSGSYLAARHAGDQRDVAAAASYYRAALRGDPDNNELLGRTFLAVLANGEVDEGVRLAERVLQVDKNDSIARLVLGVRAIKQKQYPVARRELVQSVRGPITDLAAMLLSAWTMANPSEAKRAANSIDKLAGADWYAIFKELHAALILDVAGQKKEAAKRFERSYKLDPTALRVVQSYGSFLSRQGNNADALKVFAAFEEALPRHPLIV